MTRRQILSVLLSVLIVAAVGFRGWMEFTPRGVPVEIRGVDSNVSVIAALPYHALPLGIEAGDRFDFRQQDFLVRVAKLTPRLPMGQSFDVVVQRGRDTLTVPVTVIELREQPGLIWFALPVVCGTTLMAGIALLLIWRGRDRAAFGMGLWAITFLLSAPVSYLPLTGWPALAAMCLGIVLFLVARIGFYIMVEARVGAALSPGLRAGFRWVFWVLLMLGAVQAFGGPLLQIGWFWGELQKPQYGLILTASFLVPILMLFVGYRSAAVAERQRLRWMLMGGLAWAAGILLQNTPALGQPYSAILSNFLLVLAVLGFLYAVLRHRVVDIAVIMDRALVYGGVTTLVVGILAAINSLALRETLTPGASLLLQLVVPLSLGIVLGKLRSYLDRIVERVFFRKKYLAEKALRTFARRVGHMEDITALLDAAAGEIQHHVGTPALALYSAESDGYRCVRQVGMGAFPEQLKNDDAAFVALRADRKAVDLESVSSRLGSDGCVFPMLVFGNLRGALVCLNRPGEHFAADEKKLLTRVAREVGAAWRILRARENEALVMALASGTVPPEALKEKARALTLAWTDT